MIIPGRYGYSIICDKCNKTKNYDISIISKEAVSKYNRKRTFCGDCIQKRIHREDLDYVHYTAEELAYMSKSENLKERESSLNDLMSAFFI